jgi:predicted TIM-barrel fold metal-dependent hydrolase
MSAKVYDLSIGIIPPMSVMDEQVPLPQDLGIVDADVHAGFTEGEIVAQLSEPYKSQVEGNFPLITSSWDVRLGGKIDKLTANNPEDIRSGLCEPFGIDVPILNTLAKLPALSQSDLAVNLMRAYNDALIEKYLDDWDNFRGLASIATQKPDKAAEELDRVGSEKQIVGAFILNVGVSPPPGDPTYDVLYQAAEDNDLPIVFHSAAGSGFKYEFPKQHREFEQFLSIHNLAHLWAQSMALTSLIVQGAPVKFPDLDFVMLEAGIGWVPYMMFRLNKEYAIRRSEAPLLEKTPEEYIRESFYFSTQPIAEPNNSSHLRELLSMTGVDSIMFSSDYPHWDFDNIESVVSKLSTAETEQVLNATPAEVFNVDV